jgi:O-antigen/teichoic acid export membrane protein
MFLYILNSPTIGALVSYSSLLFVSTILFAYSLFRAKSGARSIKADEKASLTIRETLRAGLSSWVPHVIYVLGTQLGIITTTAAMGASDGGRFYIAFGIFTVTLFIIISITKVTHSLIPGMKTSNEQAAFGAYSIKIGFIFTMPIAVPFFFFSGDVLSLLGADFSKASVALSILMLNLPFVIVSEIIYYYVYGKGNHRAVLFLGLIGNLPRITLYFVLPIFIGVNGAAVAYIVGSVVQLIYSIIVANKEFILLDFRSYAKISIIPVIIGIATWAGGLNFWLSSSIISVASIMIYVRLKIVEEPEVKNITYTMLPSGLADSLYPYILRLIKAIHR